VYDSLIQGVDDVLDISAVFGDGTVGFPGIGADPDGVFIFDGHQEDDTDGEQYQSSYAQAGGEKHQKTDNRQEYREGFAFNYFINMHGGDVPHGIGLGIGDVPGLGNGDLGVLVKLNFVGCGGVHEL
jgi:hypothetical protein